MSFGPQPLAAAATGTARAAGNFICGGAGSGLIVFAALLGRGGAGAGVLLLAGAGAGRRSACSACWLEIGRPLRALNVFFNPRTSWMTREALRRAAAVRRCGAGRPPAAWPRLRRWPRCWRWPSSTARARMLQAAKGIPAWREPLTVPLIVATGAGRGRRAVLLLAPLRGGPAHACAAGWSSALLLRRALRRCGSATGAPPARARRARWPRSTAPARACNGRHAAAAGRSRCWRLAAPLPPAAPAALRRWPARWPRSPARAFKFTLVTRAGFNQGFALPHLPVRGVRRCSRRTGRGAADGRDHAPKRHRVASAAVGLHPALETMPRDAARRAAARSACARRVRNACDARAAAPRAAATPPASHPDDIRTPRRPRAAAVHGQDRPARPLSVRPVRAAGRRAGARCTRRRARPASRPSSATRAATSTRWADLMARSLAGAGARPRRRRPQRLRLRPVHRRPRRALRRRAAGRRRWCRCPAASTERQVALIVDFGARVLCATPSYALAIAEVAEQQGVDLRAEPRCEVGLFGAEPWSEAMRARDRGAAGPAGGRHLRPVRDHGPGRGLRMRVPQAACTAGRTTSCSRSSTPRPARRCPKARPANW